MGLAAHADMMTAPRRRTGLKKPLPRRVAYEASFKLKVVREALLLPASNRIKPTCRLYPQIEPVTSARPLCASPRPEPGSTRGC